MWALEDIGQGRRSPLLPIQVNNDEGETLKSRTRFALVRMEDGKVDVVFYPQLEKSPLEAFTQEQQEDLLAGKAILADVKDADGRSSKAFVQAFIVNPYWIIFQQMTLLLIATVLMMAMIVYCLVYQIRIIAHQNKIARMREDFSYAMIHEMKTPLACILMVFRELYFYRWNIMQISA